MNWNKLKSGKNIWNNKEIKDIYFFMQTESLKKMSACWNFYFLNLLSSTVFYSNPIFSVHYICSAESRVKLWKWTGKWRQELEVDRKGKLSKLTRIGSGQKGETFTTDKQKGFIQFGNINFVTVMMKIQLLIKSWSTKSKLILPSPPTLSLMSLG
jgi:hypothetical protein